VHQFACAALIGICMAAVLRGSSSILFFILGVSPSQQPRKKILSRQSLPPPTPAGVSRTPSESGLDSGGEGSSRASSSSSLHRRGKEFASRIDAGELQLYESRFKAGALSMSSGSSSGKSPSWPRRRSRGLLAQTIHEESSESESM
jgi:hypothetical protein